MVRAEQLREILVGAVALGILAAILAWFYSGQHVAARARMESYKITADFNRIDGLDVGAEVRLSGIVVGKVAAVALAPNYRVHVTMRIDQGVKVPADTAAAIQTDGLFGSKFMTLDPGGDERSLADGGVITFTQDSMVVSDLLDLIIAEGRAARGQAAGSADENGQAREDAPSGLLGGSQ